MRVAFLGLGIMGSRMAANLAAAGHDVAAWTRTAGKAAAWADGRDHARPAESPGDAAHDAEVVISMVVDGPQVRDVVGRAAAAAPADTLCVDMSTIGPAAAREVGASLAGAGHRFVDAPVTGSSPKAQEGTLTIMCGGDAADVEQARPLLDAMGSLVVHAGPVGQGQLVKVVNNAVAAANTATAAQALLVGAAAGADLDALVEVCGAGSGQSAVLDLKATPMREHDFTTLFKAEHMLKDVRLCLAEADAAGVSFPAAHAAADALAAVVEAGDGDADFAALLEVYERAARRTL